MAFYFIYSLKKSECEEPNFRQRKSKPLIKFMIFINYLKDDGSEKSDRIIQSDHVFSSRITEVKSQVEQLEDSFVPTV